MTEAGTPLSATNLNKIEQGIEDAQDPDLILAAIKNVDGAGSGLDADLLDGLQASAFARSGFGLGVALLGVQVTDLNATYLPGMYYAHASATPLPSGVQDGALFVMGYSDLWVAQQLHDWRTNVVWKRQSNNGVWGTWSATRDNAGVLELFTGGEWKPVAGVKSIQTGNLTPAASTSGVINVTISAVNQAKSTARLTNVTNRGDWMASVYLTSGTNLAVEHYTFSSPDKPLRWEVIEYY